jgi:hypothetical protein
MSGGYAGKLQGFLAGIVPWWLQGPNAGAFLESIGLTLDLANSTLLDGLRGAQPLKCFLDALPYIGADRGLRRYPTEPSQSYRRRLAQWRQIKKHYGSHYGEMINLQPYFLPGRLPLMRIVHQAGDGSTAVWHTLTPNGNYLVHHATPSNWNWDGVPAKASRFWLIIYVSSVGSDAAAYDDGTTWDDGSTVWDGHLTSAQVDDIVEIVNEAKAAHSMLWGVILATTGASFLPTATATTDANGATSLPVGNWGSAIDATTGEPSRLYTAAFPYDLGQG